MGGELFEGRLKFIIHLLLFIIVLWILCSLNWISMSFHFHQVWQAIIHLHVTEGQNPAGNAGATVVR